MKTVKLTTPWKLPYLEQSPKGTGIWGDYKFEINNDCDEADYWVIWGWEPKPIRTVRVPKNHTVYLSDEAHAQRFYHMGFLDQFEKVATPRKDLVAHNIVPYQEIAPWYLPLNWDEMEALSPPQKIPNTVSVISSNLTYLPSHLQRFAFVNQCIGHFKQRLHAFGRGINPIEDKRLAFFPYPYTIALENSAIDDYFTEKIREVFLSYGYPFYWGCPNLQSYFDKDSFSFIDINDLKTSIEIIEEAMGKDYRNQRLDLIVSQRNKVLYEYHLFPALSRLLDTLPEASPSKKLKITPEDIFWKQDQSLAKRAIQKLKSSLS